MLKFLKDNVGNMKSQCCIDANTNHTILIMTMGPEALNEAADMKSKRLCPVDAMKRNILHQ